MRRRLKETINLLPPLPQKAWESQRWLLASGALVFSLCLAGWWALEQRIAHLEANVQGLQEARSVLQQTWVEAVPETIRARFEQEKALEAAIRRHLQGHPRWSHPLKEVVAALPRGVHLIQVQVRPPATSSGNSQGEGPSSPGMHLKGWAWNLETVMSYLSRLQTRLPGTHVLLTQVSPAPKGNWVDFQMEIQLRGGHGR